MFRTLYVTITNFSDARSPTRKVISSQTFCVAKYRVCANTSQNPGTSGFREGAKNGWSETTRRKVARATTPCKASSFSPPGLCRALARSVRRAAMQVGYQTSPKSPTSRF